MFEPTALPPGAKVTEPGLYEMSIERYHGDICDGPSASSSGLRKLFSESPAHFYAESWLNPDREPRKDTTAFALGRAAHHLLLGEADFAKHFVVRPEKWDSWRTNDAKTWRADQEASGKTVLTPDDVEAVRGMSAGLQRHPLVRAGILNGQIELSMIWRDVETGLWLKARPDAIPNDGGDFSDLKTTTSVDGRDLVNTIADYGYHAQGALIAMGAREVLKVPFSSFSLVFVEKKPPYCCRVVTLTPEDLELGAQQIRAALRLMRRCLDTGEWPGPGGTQADAEYMALPQWARDRIINRLGHIEQELAA